MGKRQAGAPVGLLRMVAAKVIDVEHEPFPVLDEELLRLFRIVQSIKLSVSD